MKAIKLVEAVNAQQRAINSKRAEDQKQKQAELDAKEEALNKKNQDLVQPVDGLFEKAEDVETVSTKISPKKHSKRSEGKRSSIIGRESNTPLENQ